MKTFLTRLGQLGGALTGVYAVLVGVLQDPQQVSAVLTLVGPKGASVIAGLAAIASQFLPAVHHPVPPSTPDGPVSLVPKDPR